MTFIEALAEYHNGKAIRREGWNNYFLKEIIDMQQPLWNAEWKDILADDWMAYQRI